MAEVTDKQRAVLEALCRRGSLVTARALADEMEGPAFRSARFTYDEVYGQLRTLERKGLVQARRGPRAKNWAPTDAGRELAAVDGHPDP